jgi:hypothetical protein
MDEEGDTSAQNGALARIHAVAPFGDALVAFPKRTHGEELRVQNRDAGGDPADVHAGVSQARGEALQEALRVRDVTPFRHQPTDDRTPLRILRSRLAALATTPSGVATEAHCE